MNLPIYKYPRTQHIEGSRFQPGDEDMDSVAFSVIAGRPVVVEEKMDGANAAISFTPQGELLLQSRGHYLTGGPREKHFNLFKQWTQTHAYVMHQVLGSRYILYGEWLYAKHTVFYTDLPHYFLEFDILDTTEMKFLSTPRRQELLAGLPVMSVRVLTSQTFSSQTELSKLLGRSHFISDDHLDVLRQECLSCGLDPQRCLRETDPSTDMEGLYLKVEENGIVTERYKFVRASFLTSVQNSEGHWLNRPIVPNLVQDRTID